MKKILLTLLPFCLIALVCAGGVELSCRWLSDWLEEALVEQTVTVEQQAKVEGSLAEEAENTATGRDDYTIIVARNLFAATASRQLDGAEKDLLDGLQATSLNLVLMGTVIGQDDDIRAIILDKGKNEQAMYRRGERIHGAEIKAILRGKVILNVSGRDEMLDMAEARKAGVSATSVSPSSRRARIISAPGVRGRQPTNVSVPQAGVKPVAKAATPKKRRSRRFTYKSPQ